MKTKKESLKALSDLRWNVSYSHDLDYAENNDLCDVIERDLKVMEMLRKWFHTASTDSSMKKCILDVEELTADEFFKISDWLSEK